MADRKRELPSRQDLDGDDEWKAKLEMLQNFHTQETLEQQQGHLEQLRLLQNQLLTDLTSGISLGCFPSDHIPQKSPRAIVSDSREYRLSSISQELDDTTDLDNKESLFFAKQRPSSKSSSPQALTPVNLTRGNSISDSNTSENADGQRELKAISSTRSLEFLSARNSDDGFTLMSNIVSDAGSSEDALLKAASALTSKQVVQQLGIQQDRVTAKFKSSATLPVALKVAWDSSVLNSSPADVQQPVSTDSSTLFSPRLNGALRIDSSTRSLLLSKHTKHVEDLKRYYEAELSSLHETVNELEAAGPKINANQSSHVKLLHSSAVSQRSLKLADALQSSASDLRSDSRTESRLNKSELWMLQSENERLSNNCVELQAEMDEAERDKHILEGQVKRMEQHVMEWQERCESSDRMLAVLQERLDTSRSQLQKQEKITGQLTSDVKVTTEELLFWKEQKLQDVDKLDQLFTEFEVLQAENQKLISINFNLKAKLEQSASESTYLRTVVDKHKILETQYKSTVHKLEDELKRLETVNNRLHSQVTRYEQSLTEGNHISTSKKSPGQGFRTPSNMALSPSLSLVSAASVGSDTKPLTRRKWLETSVPGLIYGSTNNRLPTSKSPVDRIASRVTSANGPVKHSPRRALTFTDDVVQDPTVNNRKGHTPSKEIIVTDVGQFNKSRKINIKNGNQKLEMRVRNQMAKVEEAEKKLDQLQVEKDKLERRLQRVPKSGSRVTRESKQIEFDVERRLEQVVKEIGSVRMILRKSHAFKK